MIKVVIFDFDGVIAESVEIKTNAFARLFEDESPDMVGEIVKYHCENSGVSRFEKIRYIYSNILKRDLTNEEFGDKCSKFSALVKDEVVRAPYVSGALEFLEKYSSAYKCYISSATPQDEIESIVEKRGIRRHFMDIYGSPTSKRDIVNSIVSKSGSGPSETVYVGDARADYDAAIANGVRFIARIPLGSDVFNGIDCIKISDLRGLNGSIKNISAVSRDG